MVRSHGQMPQSGEFRTIFLPFLASVVL